MCADILGMKGGEEGSERTVIPSMRFWIVMVIDVPSTTSVTASTPSKKPASSGTSSSRVAANMASHSSCGIFEFFAFRAEVLLCFTM